MINTLIRKTVGLLTDTDNVLQLVSYIGGMVASCAFGICLFAFFRRD